MANQITSVHRLLLILVTGLCCNVSLHSQESDLGQDKASKKRESLRNKRIIQYASSVFVIADRNRNGELEKTEVKGLWWEPKDADSNQNGLVDFEEYVKKLGGKLNKNRARPSSITRDQMKTSLAKMVIALNDSNQNGILDKSEWLKEKKDWGILFHPHGAQLLLRKAHDFNDDSQIAEEELVVLFGGTPPENASKEAKYRASKAYRIERLLKEKDKGLEIVDALMHLNADNFSEISENMDPERLMARIVMFLGDDNGDRLLDQNEIKNLVRPDGQKLVIQAGTDKNNDKRVSLSELEFSLGYRNVTDNDLIVTRSIREFLEADKNRDRKLSPQEIKNALWFHEKDGKRDRDLSLDELIVNRGGQSIKRLGEPIPLYLNFDIIRQANVMMERHDRDGDKSLNQTELNGLSELRFVIPNEVRLLKKSDTDNDGKTSLNEMIIALGAKPVSSLEKSRFEYARQVLEAYDENGNQLLEKNEYSSINWLLNEVDGSADGKFDNKFSLQELEVRFEARKRWIAPEVVKEQQSSRNKKIIAYAKSIMKKYDKNDNGKLDKPEFDGVRSLPPGADKNRNNEISLQELVEGFGGKYDN